jgi:hypothetical protein
VIEVMTPLSTPITAARMPSGNTTRSLRMIHDGMAVTATALL